MAHYAFGIVVLTSFDHAALFREHADEAAWSARTIRWAVALTMLFSMAYVANGFLIMALTAAGVGDEGVRRVWRARLSIDAVVAVAAFVLSGLGRLP
jgi:hypothetical protein